MIELESGLMCELHGIAVANEGKLELSEEPIADSAVEEMLGFLARQGWLRVLTTSAP